MSETWVVVFLLLQGSLAFMIHNKHGSLCLEDSGPEVLLRRCNLESEAQQWVWFQQDMLMCLSTSRCLSAWHTDPVRTQSCEGPGVDPSGLRWDCDRDRLISRNSSMLLSSDRHHLTLSKEAREATWRSVDRGDICLDPLRFRRASELEQFEVVETDKEVTMTEEQRKFLQWYYRTEDSSLWTFVLLGLAFVCLLIGFLLLGMGAMASRNRRQIAKYKAAAALAHRNQQELQVISVLQDDASSPSLQRQQEVKTPPTNGDVTPVQPGSILVTMKDGNTSCAFSDGAAVIAPEQEVEQVSREQELEEQFRLEQDAEQMTEDLVEVEEEVQEEVKCEVWENQEKMKEVGEHQGGE